MAQLWLYGPSVATFMDNSSPTPSVAAHGKFFTSGGRKFFLKAMRLETGPDALDFNERLRLQIRLQELKEAHTTGLVVNGPQAETVLDFAGQLGLGAMLEIAIDPEELVDRSRLRTVTSRVSRTATLFRGHRGVAGYLLDLRADQYWLKTQGVDRIRHRLRDLLRTIKEHDGSVLVAIRHRPETRALTLFEEDLIYSSVGAVGLSELRNYILSLHNIAEARPVVVEFEQPSPAQDEQVACAFALGAAGVVAGPTRPAPRPDLLQVRRLTADELLPFVTLNGACPPKLPQAPMVTVVICAYDAERTMRPCLESLRTLDYPNYEVVIVDDGSRDRTAEIAMDFPEFRLIRQPNKGLSEARNVGMHAARGEIIAYTDSDCVVDPHWLALMVRAMVENQFDACGGPNYAPAEESRVAACVAASPGAPCHVLTAEDRAEHLAGCNMLFRKSLLLKLGGFDPQFTAAGDDVDICWRALDAGAVLGFCPAAFVWHFRRNTIKAYYHQQRGYGRAEAMLYFKYPQRFNTLGQIIWKGRIPGLARTLPGGGRKRVMWATGSRAFFQTIYEREQGLLKFLPQTLEWNLAAIFILAISIAAGWTMLPALAMLAMGPIWALHYGWQAQIEKRHACFNSRVMVAALSYSGPMTRALTRYRLRLRGAWSVRTGADRAPRQRATIDWRARGLRLAYWNERWTPREALLDRLVKLFARRGRPVIVDQGWNDHDLEVRPDAWTRIEIKTADEEHEGGRLKNHVLARVRLSAMTSLPLIAMAIATCATAWWGLPTLALALCELTMVGAAFALSELIESARLAHSAIEQCAAELELIPLGKPTAAARRAAAAAAERTIGDPGRKPSSQQGLIAENRPTD